MLNKNNLKDRLFIVTNEEELNEISASYKEPLYVIFTDWYKAPFTFRLKSPLTTRISYWPESMIQELWNPETNKISKGLIFKKERMEAILSLREFDKNLRRYGIPLKTYIIEALEVGFFDRNNKPARQKDPEKEAEKELKYNLAKEKTAKLELEIKNNPNSYAQLFSYLVFMAANYIDKIMDHKEFRKYDIELQKYIYMNVMWIFMNDKSTISKALKIDLSVAQIKNIYEKYAWDYTSNYFDNDYKVVFDKNLAKITNTKLKQQIHKYSELFADQILVSGLQSTNIEFRKNLKLDLNDLKLNGEEFKLNKESSFHVPTAKSIDKIETKDSYLNIENIIKAYVYYVRETINEFKKIMKARKVG